MHRRALLFLAASALAIAAASPAAAATGPSQSDLYLGTVPDDVIAASAAPGHHWAPEAAAYGVGELKDQPVTMSDGVVLRVNVYYPTGSDGTEAAGPFPVLLTQTPYGKSLGDSAPAGTGSGATGGADDYLVERGFIDVVADVRGTGDSGGNWGLFDPVQTTDGVTLVNYAAGLPHSTHEVGLYGPSYLGINQLLTAGAVGKNSPLKAIFPLVSATDIYRDTAFMGGIVDAEFGASYLGGITSALNVANPVVDAAQNPTGDPQIATVLAQHATNVATYNASFIGGIEAGDANSYDGDYWQARQPDSILSNIVANGIPAYLVGGEYDIFQRGEPMNFAGLQNAYAGRPVDSPMPAGVPVTGRYQLLDGPFTHLVGSAPKIDALELEWFDTWLKGEDTGMADTPTPLHYFDIGTNTYAETTTYPLTGETPTRYYLGAGTLTTEKPAASDETLVWSPTGSPCGRSVDQWGLGAYSEVTNSLQVTSAPCVADDSTTQLSPIAQTFTTAAFPAARVLAGPISATLSATSSVASDTQFVVEVEDVAPDGTSKPLTEGALLGSLRAVDASRSWSAADGSLLLPYHPYTQASSVKVPTGQPVTYDVEVFPTYSTIAAGHKIRVTVSTADAPHLAATTPEIASLTGGIYQLHLGVSSVELPLSTGSAAVKTTTAKNTTAKKKAAATKKSAAAQPSGTLAYTGLAPVLPAAGLVLLGAALAVRRRRA